VAAEAAVAVKTDAKSEAKKDDTVADKAEKKG
jgi:hypothetical protein